MKAKFKIGDKVRILDGSNIKDYTGGFTYYMRERIGKEVTIKSINHTSYANRIGYRMEECYCIFDERGLEPVKNETIVIYRKDNKVIALDKNTGEKAIAKCHPQDKFDFYFGVKLAFSRLTGTPFVSLDVGEEKPKYYSGLVQCLTPNDRFTLGKIYEVKNGEIVSDDNNTWPMGNGKFKDFEDFCEYFKGREDRSGKRNNSYFTLTTMKFVEIKEVKRVAKPGEYIRTKRGNVFKVKTHHSSTYKSYVFPVGGGGFIYDDEYVVLEGCVDVNDKKIKVGDKVKVINNGKQYTTYDRFFKDNGVDINIAARYCYGKDIPCDNVYEVLFIGKHAHWEDEPSIAVVKQYNGCCYLMGVDGLEKC